MNYEELYDQVEALKDLHQVKLIHSLCDFMLCEEYRKNKSSITSPDDLTAYLSWMKFEEYENFVCITLNSQNQVINVHKITQGTVNQTPVHPRESFRKAILDNATSVVFAHNHPSGNTEPSNEDMAITRTLCAAGKILQIPVLDHIIVGKGGFTSLCRQFPEMFENTFSPNKNTMS